MFLGLKKAWAFRLHSIGRLGINLREFILANYILNSYIHVPLFKRVTAVSFSLYGNCLHPLLPKKKKVQCLTNPPHPDVEMLRWHTYNVIQREIYI